MPEISIIVPVYNTRKYLPRCLDSLLSQTFTDFELLLIDDGSTDGSAELCESYAARDSRVRLVRSERLGVGFARNLGLKEAKGDYIMFCDSDDFTEPEWAQTLLDAVKAHPSSLPNCDYAEYSSRTGQRELVTLKGATRDQLVDKSRYFPMAMCGAASHLWTRIFSAEVIKNNDLSFRTDMIQGEDIVFIAEYLMLCDSIYYIRKSLYNWADNGAVTLSRAYCPHCFEDLKAICLARRPLIDKSYTQDFYNDAFKRFMKCIQLAEDKQNAESESDKRAYCAKILLDPVFREVFNNADERVCPREKRLALIKKTVICAAPQSKKSTENIEPKS